VFLNCQAWDILFVKIIMFVIEDSLSRNF
jgi:hypothetical protein